MKDFYTMIVPEGALEKTLQDYDADWLNDHNFKVVALEKVNVVSAMARTEGVLTFFRKLREAALRIQELFVVTEMSGMPRVPTTDYWGILCRMDMDYRHEPLDFKTVPLSSYAY